LPAAWGAAEAVGANGEANLAKQILEAAQMQGGLVVHLGCGEGKLTAKLGAGGPFVVHGLEADAAKVAAARERLQAKGVCGRASVEPWTGKSLPYADNLVNLLVVEDLGKATTDEVTRVLAPRGVALIFEASGPAAGICGEKIEIAGRAATRIVKPWPAELDQWTHFLHDATGNAVAHDRVVAPPKRLQWIGGPLWSRSHEYDASLCAMVSSEGRLFYIFDEGPTGIVDPRIPDRWTLIARDAFNGVMLWKRPIADWGWKAWKRAALEAADWRRMPSQRFRLPLSIPRRLVGAGERVYATLGYRAPLTALDAATGRTITTYAGTEGTDEIVHRNGRLVLCVRAAAEAPESQSGQKHPAREEAPPGVLMAIQAETGRRLWQTEPETVVPLSLVLSSPHVLYHDRDAVVCLDADSGRQRWRTPTGRAGNSIWNTDRTLLAYEQVALCASRRQLVGLSLADGKPLWKLPGAKGFGIANPPDLFVADGLVWYAPEGIHAQTLTGYDPSTGEPARTVNLGMVITRGHHARCYRSKATDRYLLLPKRAVEFIDVRGGPHTRHNWVRGACRYGLLPSGGLLYSTPHPCFCYAGVKLGGFLALSSQEVNAPTSDDTSRLVRGPAYDALAETEAKPASREAGADDWPMYRHDPKRSGGTSAQVGPQVRPTWTRQLGGKLTQPVVVGPRVFVARVDAGQVCCLDASTGEPVWRHVAGARVDSAPTYHRGRLIFGSADGWVYCLRASDGALRWRFRAAPDERRVVAFGQVESVWPVHGSVLVMGDVAYCTAGRSSFLDGGITLYGLDPATGEKRYETRLDGPHADTTRLDENAYAMEGAKTDVLVTDGELIYLFHNAFNRRLEKQPTPIQGEPGVKNLGVRDFAEHLFSNAGFLDDSWFNRSHWMVGDRWTAFNFAHQSPKAGQLVVFDDARTYAVKCFVRRNLLSPLFFPATDGYFLVADRSETRPVLVPSDGKQGPEYLRWLPQAGQLQTCWNLGVGFARENPPQWVQNVPVRMLAMVRTANALFAAGPPDVCDPDDPAGALEGRQGAVLLAFDPADGEQLFECPLPAPPVFDALCAAHGRLFLSTTGGDVMCMSSRP
jgi:outer membrane protein assembly factor BamB